jgi:hypothetical protein
VETRKRLRTRVGNLERRLSTGAAAPIATAVVDEPRRKPESDWISDQAKKAAPTYSGRPKQQRRLISGAQHACATSTAALRVGPKSAGEGGAGIVKG